MVNRVVAALLSKSYAAHAPRFSHLRRSPIDRSHPHAGCDTNGWRAPFASRNIPSECGWPRSAPKKEPLSSVPFGLLSSSLALHRQTAVALIEGAEVTTLRRGRNAAVGIAAHLNPTRPHHSNRAESIRARDLAGHFALL